MKHNITAIYPPTSHVLAGACHSCGSDVRCDNGFADLDKRPFRGYLCSRCAMTAIGGTECSRLLQESQDRERESRHAIRDVH